MVFTGKIEGKQGGVELLAQSIGLTVQKAVSKNTFVIFGSDVGQTKLIKQCN